MTKDEIHNNYSVRYPSLELAAKTLVEFLTENLPNERIDRITGRAKSIESFVAKATKTVDGNLKYPNPFASIQDQIGARIIVFYKQDVERISKSILKLFRPIEQISKEPERQSEFGYEGKHFILILPSDVFGKIDGYESNGYPELFELQIKTLFQHAWGEANHDLAYKGKGEMCKEHKRKVAFTAAQAWGADTIFSELFDDLSSSIECE